MTVPMTDTNETSIGARLRARREELDISLDQVVARTRIRRVYLEALEGERFDEFPGEAYLKGYLKGYAESLGLDPQPLLAELARQKPSLAPPLAVESLPDTSAGDSGTVPRARRSGGGMMLLAAVVVLALAGAAWWLNKGGTATPEGERAAPVAPTPSPQTTGPDNPTVPPVPADAAKVEPGPVEGNPGPAQPGQSTEASPPPATALADPPPLQDVAAADAGLPGASAAGVLRLQANGPGQLELTIDGRPAQRYSLQANTILSWKIGRSARIYVDNPGNVRLWLGGNPVDMAGLNQIVLEPGEESAR